MPKFKVYDWQCEDCQHKEEVIVDVSEDGWDCAKACCECGTGAMHRVPSLPTVQKASFVDGTKRKGSEDMKRVAQLEVQRANTPPAKRAEIDREIAARRKIK